MQPITTNQQGFTTQLPYLQQIDNSTGDTAYINFLYDSLNPNTGDSAFTFEIKKIVLPDSAQSSKVSIERPSLLFPDKSKAVQFEPKQRANSNYDWLTGVFILSLVLLVWIRYEGERRVTALFKAVFARHHMNQLLRDGDVIHERLTPGLLFVYLVSFSTLLMLVFAKFNLSFDWIDNSFLLFSVILSSVLLLWLVKNLAVRITGWIFRTKPETEEYIITNIIYNAAMGLVAFPFVFGSHYADNEISLYIAGGIFSTGLFLKFIRSIFVGLSAQTFPVVYLFLYLCTLEILPFLVLYKIITG